MSALSVTACEACMGTRISRPACLADNPASGRSPAAALQKCYADMVCEHPARSEACLLQRLLQMGEQHQAGGLSRVRPGQRLLQLGLRTPHALRRAGSSTGRHSSGTRLQCRPLRPRLARLAPAARELLTQVRRLVLQLLSALAPGRGLGRAPALRGGAPGACPGQPPGGLRRGPGPQLGDARRDGDPAPAAGR